MSNAWKKNATFLSRNCVTCTVNGQDIDFYAVSPRVAFRLRGISRPLAQALTCLFEDKSKDTRRTMRDVTDTKEGVSSSETVIDAINADVLRERSAEREKAIDHLIGAFSERANQLLLMEILWDSMRGVFGTAAPSEDELRALADDPELDVPTLIRLLKGVAAANFDSLSGWAGKIGTALSGKLKAEMDKIAAEPPQTASTSTSTSQDPTPSPTASVVQEETALRA